MRAVFRLQQAGRGGDGHGLAGRAGLQVYIHALACVDRQRKGAAAEVRKACRAGRDAEVTDLDARELILAFAVGVPIKVHTRFHVGQGNGGIGHGGPAAVTHKADDGSGIELCAARKRHGENSTRGQRGREATGKAQTGTPESGGLATVSPSMGTPKVAAMSISLWCTCSGSSGFVRAALAAGSFGGAVVSSLYACAGLADEVPSEQRQGADFVSAFQLKLHAFLNKPQS